MKEWDLTKEQWRGAAADAWKISMNAYGSDWPEGAVIEMFGERFRIAENLGRYGAVVSLEPDDDSFYARFYWQYDSDRAVLISTPNKTDHKV